MARAQKVGFARFVGHDVEVRAGHGSLFRGRFLGLDGDCIRLERMTDGRREILVPLTAVVAVLDEQRIRAGEAPSE